MKRWMVAAVLAALTSPHAVAQEQPVLVVEEIAAGSAAAKAGLAVGDRVVSYDGRRLVSPATLQAAEENTLRRHPVVVVVEREDETPIVLPLHGRLGVQARPFLSATALQLYEQGREALKSQRTDIAIAAWSAAARAAREAGDRIAAAWLHGRVGEIRENQRQWTEATAEHAMAWALVRESGDVAAQSRTLLALSRCSQNSNDFPTAHRWAEQAERVDTAAGNNMWASGDLTALGVIARSSGDLAGAEDYHRRALTIRERLAPKSLDAATSLNNLGGVLHSRGNLAGAHDYYSHALSIRERLAPDSLDVSFSLNNLGMLAFDRGDLAEAQSLLRRTLAIKERLAPDSLVVATTVNNLGIVARKRGDLVVSEDYQRRALAIRGRLAPDSMAFALSLHNLGVIAWARGDLTASRDYFSRALAIRERLAPESMWVAETLDSLGDVALASSDLTAAQQSHSRALAIRERLAPNSVAVAESLSNLGSVARSQTDLASAQAFHRRALAIRERLAPRSLDEASSLNHLGSIALGEGHPFDALPLFSRAIDIIETQRSRIDSTESRALLLARHTDPYHGLLRAHLALGDVPAAFAAAERSRARSLLEILSEARAEIRQGVDPIVLRDERLLQRQINDKARQQMQLLAGRPTPEETGQVKQELDALLVRYQGAQAEIRASSPRYAALTQPQPLGLAEIQRDVLDEGTLLLEYVLGDERSYLFAVTPTSIKSFVLPARAAVERAARRVYQSLIARQPVAGESAVQRRTRLDKADADYPAAAAALSQMVLQPVAADLRGQRLLIVADGALQYIPFAALPRPGQTVAADAEPLVVTHEIISLPSASIVSVLRRERVARRPAARAVAVVADPVFDVEDSRLRRRQQATQSEPVRTPLPVDVTRAARAAGLTDDRGALARLAFTRDEADAIVALAPKGEATRVVDFSASRATVTGPELGRYRIVHLATHGLLDAEHPELSGLVLSLVDEDGRRQDGFLRLHEVYNLNWSADLVVLSACQTALGKEIRGEGLVGLTRGFMYGGAERVIASVWNVNDSVTAQFMRRFYEGIFGKALTPAAALRAAQIDMWRRQSSRSPYYWAAFVLQGEWR